MSQLGSEFCNQWNTPPARYKNEHGEVELSSKCGYPSTWEVFLHGRSDYACDVHLAQAASRFCDEARISVIIISRKGKT